MKREDWGSWDGIIPESAKTYRCEGMACCDMRYCSSHDCDGCPLWYEEEEPNGEVIWETYNPPYDAPLHTEFGR